MKWGWWERLERQLNDQDCKQKRKAQTIIQDAETEIQRLVAKRTLMKLQLRDMPDLIDAQFEIINKAKALLNEVNKGETK